MTYAKKTLSEIKLIHGNYGNFIKGQKLDKKKEKKYKTPPYQDLAASNEIDGEPLDEKCWPGYEKKGMKTMFGKRYPNCVKKKKTRKEDFSDWRSELEEIEEKKMTKAQIKKRDEIADAISTKDMKDRYGDKNVKYAIATKLAMKEGVGSLVKSGLKLLTKSKPLLKTASGNLTKAKPKPSLLGKVATKVGGALTPGYIGYEIGKDMGKTERDNIKKELELSKQGAAYDQGYYDSVLDSYRKQIEDMKKKPVKEDNIQEILDKKDIPHVKKLVGKLRKGSKTHAKQADDLEKAMKENTAIESELIIQDWNKDDIKFTEIETVDIIKAEPLKEAKKKIIVKGLKALGNLSKKTKIKSISPKPVATPGTTFATGGKFPPGTFSNVPDYAGALPKATKTGGQMYSTTYDLGTRISPGAIKPVKGAFKGGGSLKGRIDPGTGNRVSFKKYKDIMKTQYGKNYYEPVKGAKFGDKVMATNRKAFEPAIKQEKLPYPKPREGSKFKIRDDATFGDQIMVRKNEPFSRNFTGRTPMPKPLGKAKYEVGKKGVDEFTGGDMYSKVGFRSFKDKKYGFPGLKKPASAPKDASRLYEPKGYRDYTPKRDMPTTNPEAGRVLFGKGELKTGVKKKGKTIYKENVDLDEKFGFLKKAFGKAIILGTGASKAMGKSPRLSRKASISLTTGKALKGFKDAIQKVKDLKQVQKMSDAPSKFPRDKQIIKIKKKTSPNAIFPTKANVKIKNEIISDTGISTKNPIKKIKKDIKDHYDWRAELDEDWQKVNRKDKTDGLSRKAVKAYRRENPGSKLQTAVTKDPKKLKKGSKSAKRRLSFCRRMKGMKKKLTSAKTRRDPDSRINKALRRWNC